MKKSKSFCQNILKTYGDGSLPSRYLKIRNLKPCDQTTGGIIMTDSAKESRRNTLSIGQVLSVGKDAYEKEHYKVPYCKEGDYVFFDFSERKDNFMKDEFLKKRLDFTVYYVPDYAVIDVIHSKDVSRYGLLPYDDHCLEGRGENNG